MGAITSTKSARRTLIDAASLAVFAVKSPSSITRSGTTATVTLTSHGYSANDWILHGGATHPYYNGPFQVASVVDANTYTITLRGDPGGSASGTLTAQKGLGSTVWGDGTTPSGLSSATVGSLPTSLTSIVNVRYVNGSSAPAAAPTFAIFVSDVGTPGTWDAWQSLAGSITNLDDATRSVDVTNFKFVLVFAYGNTTNALTVSAWGLEMTGAY